MVEIAVVVVLRVVVVGNKSDGQGEVKIGDW